MSDNTQRRTAGDRTGKERGTSGSIRNVVKTILTRKLGSEQSRHQVACEKGALLLFCQVFQAERQFSQLPYHPTITKLLYLLQSQRVCESWMMGVGGEGGSGDSDHARCVLMTLRLLLRDEVYQKLLMKGAQSLATLAKSLSSHAEAYLNGSLQSIDILKELTNIFQKLSSGTCHGDAIMSSVPDVIAWLVQLLAARDLTVTQSCLCTLINICKSPSNVEAITPTSILPHLLHILQCYDTSSRHMSSDLLLLLTSHSLQVTQCLKEMDGLPLCLRLLRSDDLHILYRVVSVIERLSEDKELQDDFRLLGGVPLLLALLSKSVESSSSQDKVTVLKSATCSAITQLASHDTNSLHFAQGNGVYLLAKLIIPARDGDNILSEGLQRNAWRALRYLYSTERNRRQFRRLFPPKLFETFIDVGHYVRHSDAYIPLVQAVTTMTATELAGLQSSIEEANTLRSPLFIVRGYHVQELLGSGAFGNVYKVRKRNSETFLAMKEIKATLPLLGGSVEDRASSIGKIMNEVNIIKEQLHHPNVVHYHKCFEEGGHLYIIMELIEGAPLIDHITSLSEKRERFKEDRIWSIFTQLTLALRYLHKDKQVTHRDLTPSNLMLGENDKLTITDFGLAKQKQREFSVMQSTVGTLSYWCPELVRSEPYSEKADVWAAGCILYQMATLHVPFQTTNILALAKKIAEVDYPAIPDGLYSTLLSTIVSRCLTADPSQRPDSVELGALLVHKMMIEADRLAISQESLQHRLDRERQRTLRHQQRYHHLASVTQATQLTTSTSTHIDCSADSTHRRLSESFVTHPPLLTSPTSHSPTITRVTQEPHTHSETTGMEWGLSYSPTLFHKCSAGSMESGLDWDGESDSSENVFPEPTQDPPNMATNNMSFYGDELSAGVQRENPSVFRLARGRSHSAVVPGQMPPLRYLNGGRGHGAVRSQTASTGSGRSLPGVGVALTGSPLRHRTTSSSSVLCLSSCHVREIADPITTLLATLHHLLTLSLSMPTSCTPSSRLMILERYQRSLFHSSVSPAQIKGELHRLGSRSGEGVWLLEEGVWSVGPRLLRKALEELSVHGSTLTPTPPLNLTEPCTLTYELLATMIDSLHSERTDAETSH